MKLSLALLAAAGALALSGTASAGPAEDIMAKEKCSKCHTATTSKKGPSFADVAAKYQGKPDAVATLVDVLKTGGKVDHDPVKASDADLKAIAELVLSSK